MIRSLPLILILLLSACSSMRSGKYVKMQGTLADLAREYGVSESDIRQANPGVHLTRGKIVFVPQPIGFVPAIQGYRSASIKKTSSDYIWPLPGVYKISSNYGKRHGRHHDGIDIAAPTGTPIVAVNHGEVIFSGNMRGYGQVTILAHGDQIFTVYAHASRLLVKKGQKVKKGQVIAKVGSTGRSTGPHLHFEVRRNNQHLNPLSYIPQFRSIAKF